MTGPGSAGRDGRGCSRGRGRSEMKWRGGRSPETESTPGGHGGPVPMDRSPAPWAAPAHAPGTQQGAVSSRWGATLPSCSGRAPGQTLPRPESGEATSTPARACAATGHAHTPWTGDAQAQHARTWARVTCRYRTQATRKQMQNTSRSSTARLLGRKTRGHCGLGPGGVCLGVCPRPACPRPWPQEAAAVSGDTHRLAP